MGGVIFLIWRNCARCHSSRPGRRKRLRPLVCGEEKTYTRSMWSNGIGTSEAVDLESISPQSKLMQNYLNMYPHNMPTTEMAHAAGYKYHHVSNSPCSGGTSINTPVHIELHTGLSHSRSAIGRTPDLIRVPTAVHSNMNPEYAELPGGGVYEMAAPSSMSSDNCIECQREEQLWQRPPFSISLRPWAQFSTITWTELLKVTWCPLLKARCWQRHASSHMRAELLVVVSLAGVRPLRRLFLQ